MNIKIISIAVILIAILIAVNVSRLFFKYITKSNIVTLSKEQAKRFIIKKNNSKYLEKMSRHGYLFQRGYDTEVSTYIFEKIACAILLATIGVIIFQNTVITIILTVLGYRLVDIAYNIQNKIDNEDMDEDVRNLRDTMICHSEAGVSLTDTLVMCIRESNNKRFKQALNEMYNYIVSQKLTIEEATEVFSSRFDNNKIDKICTIIVQEAKTGYSADMLNDLVRDAEIEEEAANYEREKKLESKMLCVCVIYFACIFANIIYGVAVANSNNIMNF